MVFKCIICNVRYSKDSETSFHSFPKSEAIRSLWLKICSLEEDQIGDKTKICSKHFATECFKPICNSRRNSTKEVGTKILGKNSIPSLFLDIVKPPKRFGPKPKTIIQTTIHSNSPALTNSSTNTVINSNDSGAVTKPNIILNHNVASQKQQQTTINIPVSSTHTSMQPLIINSATGEKIIKTFIAKQNGMPLSNATTIPIRTYSGTNKKMFTATIQSITQGSQANTSASSGGNTTNTYTFQPQQLHFQTPTRIIPSSKSHIAVISSPSLTLATPTIITPSSMNSGVIAQPQTAQIAKTTYFIELSGENKDTITLIPESMLHQGTKCFTINTGNSGDTFKKEPVEDNTNFNCDEEDVNMMMAEQEQYDIENQVICIDEAKAYCEAIDNDCTFSSATSSFSFNNDDKLSLSPGGNTIIQREYRHVIPNSNDSSILVDNFYTEDNVREVIIDGEQDEEEEDDEMNDNEHSAMMGGGGHSPHDKLNNALVSDASVCNDSEIDIKMEEIDNTLIKYEFADNSDYKFVNGGVEYRLHSDDDNQVNISEKDKFIMENTANDYGNECIQEIRTSQNDCTSSPEIKFNANQDKPILTYRKINGNVRRELTFQKTVPTQTCNDDDDFQFQEPKLNGKECIETTAEYINNFTISDKMNNQMEIATEMNGNISKINYREELDNAKECYEMTMSAVTDVIGLQNTAPQVKESLSLAIDCIDRQQRLIEYLRVRNARLRKVLRRRRKNGKIGKTQSASILSNLTLNPNESMQMLHYSDTCHIVN